MSRIRCSNAKKLLRIHIHYKLKFNTHADTIFKKVHRKLTAFSRITNYMELPKIHMLINTLFKVQFNYGSIIWMFHRRIITSKFNRLHERYLRIIYNDKHSNSEEAPNKALREKCAYSELFWSTFYRIRTESREILRISPYLVQMRKNADQNNSEYGHPFTQ